MSQAQRQMEAAARRVVNSNADPILAKLDWERAITHGYDLAMDNVRRDVAITDALAMWELLREAERVARSYPSPPRPGWPTRALMPESQCEASEWSQALAEMKAGVTPDQPRPAMPAPVEIDRAEVVLHLWHRYALQKQGDKQRMKQAVWAMCRGVKTGAITERTGMSRQALNRAKMAAMDDMLVPIRRWIG